MALVAIALVLSAVFLPMVFFGGSTGVIYRQFSATIVSAMALSVLLAITFSPSLAANVLRRKHASVEETWLRRRAPRVAHGIESARQTFKLASSASSTGMSATSGRSSIANGYSSPFTWACAHFCSSSSGDFRRASSRRRTREMHPSSSGSRRRDFGRTQQAELAVEQYFLHGPESKNVHTFFAVTGGGAGPFGPEHRAGLHQPRAVRSAQGIDERRGGHRRTRLRRISRPARCPGFRPRSRRDPRPWPVNRLHHELQNTSGMSRDQFAAARDSLLAAASSDPVLDRSASASCPMSPA